MTNNNDSRKAFEEFMDRHSTMKSIGNRTVESFKGYSEYDIWQAARADLLATLDKPEVVEAIAYAIQVARSYAHFANDYDGLCAKAAIEALKKELRG